MVVMDGKEEPWEKVKNDCKLVCVSGLPQVKELVCDPELDIYWSTYLKAHPNE